MQFDFRFGDITSKKQRLEQICMEFTVDNLKQIMKCAERLEIEGWKHRATVDVLYEIAVKLSLLEVEVISPSKIMDRIDEYLKDN